MKYVFEDSPLLRCSYLLRKIYGTSAIFVKSNNALNSYMRKNNDAVCFVDVSPDNQDTVDLYRSLCYEFGAERVYEFPCIEFSIIFMLFELGIKLDNNDYVNIVNLLKGDTVTYEAKSLERYLKSVLKRTDHCCTINCEIDQGFSVYEDNCEYVSRDHDCKVCIPYNIKKDSIKKFLPFSFSAADRKALYNNICRSLDAQSIYV